MILRHLRYDFGKTAACLIELNAAYFCLVLRFPAHLGANVDITSILLDAVIVLSSCYSTDSYYIKIDILHRSTPVIMCVNVNLCLPGVCTSLEFGSVCVCVCCGDEWCAEPVC